MVVVLEQLAVVAAAVVVAEPLVPLAQGDGACWGDPYCTLTIEKTNNCAGSKGLAVVTMEWWFAGENRRPLVGNWRGLKTRNKAGQRWGNRSLLWKAQRSVSLLAGVWSL